jgi:hypothetical protein
LNNLALNISNWIQSAHQKFDAEMCSQTEVNRVKRLVLKNFHGERQYIKSVAYSNQYDWRFHSKFTFFNPPTPNPPVILHPEQLDCKSRKWRSRSSVYFLRFLNGLTRHSVDLYTPITTSRNADLQLIW